MPPNQVPPSICPISIDWNVYWQVQGQPANVGVTVNLQAASVQASILDRIASVKIDNTGSSNPIDVLFPDTGDVVSCPAFSSVTFPCLTNLLSANIYATGLVAGLIPTTNIFFYNVTLPPAVDAELNASIALYKASTDITFFNGFLKSAGYDAPALGDQTAILQYPLITAGLLQILPVKPKGQYRIIGMTGYVVGVGNATPGASSIGSLSFQQFGGSGTTYAIAGYASNTTTTQGITQEVFSLQGAQLKLDATFSYGWANSNIQGSGVALFNCTYAYLPNG